jgi:hypothetical protein
MIHVLNAGLQSVGMKTDHIFSKFLGNDRQLLVYLADTFNERSPWILEGFIVTGEIICRGGRGLSPNLSG